MLFIVRMNGYKSKYMDFVFLCCYDVLPEGYIVYDKKSGLLQSMSSENGS